MKTTRNTVPQQPALFTNVRWPRARVPRRDAVLETIANAVDWDHLEALARPHYQADVRTNGRKGYSLRMMLRAHVLRYFWDMSDRQCETALLDSHAMAKFIGSDPWQPRPPSAAALCRFRKLMEETRHPCGGLLDSAIMRSVRINLIQHARLEFRPGVMTDPVFRGGAPGEAGVDEGVLADEH